MLADAIRRMAGKLDDVNKEVDASRERIAQDAQSMAVRGIRVEVRGEDVVAEGIFAAYTEFGTGRFAAQYLTDLPSEWQELAAQFYKNGRGMIPDQPYLYPAFAAERERMIRNIKEALR